MSDPQQPPSSSYYATTRLPRPICRRPPRPPAADAAGSTPAIGAVLVHRDRRRLLLLSWARRCSRASAPSPSSSATTHSSTFRLRPI